MTISRHKIVVEILVDVIDDREDPKIIANQYAEMALTYKSIGAVESKVVKVEKVL
jgi:hypothetical protein